ncbi:uncharacterized protein [Chelonus insularis]|uniref:uncharacterized protein n=1 Tax=Chelonus insularis TaxID=460826 RepID=UPI00158E1572|nr:uncharacterized protein LOC118064448 [Chelonus insularis]
MHKMKFLKLDNHNVTLQILTQIEKKVKKIYELQIIMSKLLNQKIRYMAQINPPVNNEWIFVHNIYGYIFSAYLDLRPEVIVTNDLLKDDLPWAQVRIIAILPPELINNPQIDCVYKLTTKKHSIYQRQSARVQTFEHYVNLKYVASFILCDLFHINHSQDESLDKELPESIGIIKKLWKDSSITQFIDIHYPKNGFNQHQRWNNKKSIALCIPKIIQKNFNNTLALIKFIEYYRLIGIEQFTFYKTSIAQKINSVLKFYESMNIVSVISFIHIDDNKISQFQGLSAALNDCHYRTSFYNDYEYIGVFDIDEFLILKHHKSVEGLLQYLDPSALKQDYSQYTSFSFTNIHPSDTGNISNKAFNLQSRIIPQRFSEKSYIDWKQYIVRAHDITKLPHQLSGLQMNRNFVHHSFNKRFQEMIVDPAVAFLHYSAPNKAEKTGFYAESMEIDALMKKLNKMVEKVCASIFESKECPPSDE